MKKSNVNNTREGKIHIEYLDKSTVCIELDDEGCRYLIEVFNDFINTPNMHHLDLESNTMYHLGVFTKDSLGLMINHRDNYNK